MDEELRALVVDDDRQVRGFLTIGKLLPLIKPCPKVQGAEFLKKSF